jgi:peroxiredoxin
VLSPVGVVRLEFFLSITGRCDSSASTVRYNSLRLLRRNLRFILYISCIKLRMRLEIVGIVLGTMLLGTMGSIQPIAAQQLAFKLPSTSSLVSVTAGESTATAVCFLGTECPMARGYATSLNELTETFRSRGVRIIGVFSNRQDSLQDVEDYAKELSVAFEVAYDSDSAVANRYAATRTPEVFLLDRELKLRYHGRIDDRLSPGVARNKATRQDLRVAIEELLVGKPVSVPATSASGCIIGKHNSGNSKSSVPSTEASVNFAKDIAPLLQRNCVECHRAGEIGPFGMEQFEDVVGWAETMLETIDNGRMPPWHAEDGYMDLANARRMPDEDKQLFRTWVESGMVKGDPSELPAPVKFTQGWQLPRDPDLVVEMRSRPFLVPRDGVVEYQYFVADWTFEKDSWISAAQVVPGRASVVHHAIVFVRPPDGGDFRGIGWLSAYVPGQRMQALPPGRARFVPAGSKLVFQMHYTPNGTEERDTTKIGLLFADEGSVTHEVYTLAALNQEFEIPPEAADHRVQATLPWLPREGQLLAVTPHMHFRGKSFELFGSSEDGKSTLLRVPSYDFNWQHTYQFSKPLEIEAVEQLSFVASFDNSTNNPFNPNPGEWVTWGDQTWEEMAVAFFEVSEPRNKSVESTVVPKTELNGIADSLEKSRETKIEKYIARVLKELDSNQDGRIVRSETEIVLRRWNFEFWDRNGNDVVTVDELRTIAEELYP